MVITEDDVFRSVKSVEDVEKAREGDAAAAGDCIVGGVIGWELRWLGGVGETAAMSGLHAVDVLEEDDRVLRDPVDGGLEGAVVHLGEVECVDRHAEMFCESRDKRGFACARRAVEEISAVIRNAGVGDIVRVKTGSARDFEQMLLFAGL